MKKLEAIGYRVYLKENHLCYEYLGKGLPNKKVTRPLLAELERRQEEVVSYLVKTTPKEILDNERDIIKYAADTFEEPEIVWH